MKVEKSIDIFKFSCYKSQAGGAGFVPKVRNENKPVAWGVGRDPQI